MVQATSRILFVPVVIFLLAAASTGCGQGPAIKADSSAHPVVTRVEVVKPERQRSAGPRNNPGRSRPTR